MVVQDVLPYSTTVGKRDIGVFGVRTGLGWNAAASRPRAVIEVAGKPSFRLLTRAKLNTTQAIERIRAEVAPCAEVDELLEFLASSQRGVSRNSRVSTLRHDRR